MLVTAAIQTSRAYVVPAGEGASVWFIDSPAEIKVTVEQTGGAYSLSEHTVPAGAGIPLHIHENEDEAFYVLEGYVAIQYANQHYVLGPGGYAFLPRGVAHRFANAGDGPARMLVIASPGTFDRFISECDQAARQAGTVGEISPAVVAQVPYIAARNGIEFLPSE